MNLNVSEWKPFITSRLFYDMQNGKANQQMLDEGNDCFYVGAKKDDNGVMIHCLKDESLLTKGNCIIFICNGQGSVGYANYMDVDFIGTTDIVAGYNDNLNAEIGAFLATVYSQERPKYSFGRKWKTKLADTEVNLPIKHNTNGTPFIDDTKKYSDKGYVPDWKFMEDYMKAFHHKPLTTKNKPGQAPDLIIQDWKRFYLGRLFDIKKGKRLTAEDQEDGENIYIGAIDSNNGVANHIGQQPIHEGNTISLSYNGSVGEAFYQPEPYWATDDVNALYSHYEGFNKYIGLFMAATIRQEKYRFSYGRKWTLENMKITDICLPIQHDSDNKPVIDRSHKYSDEGYIPDWQFMESYIKALPYGDRLER